MKIIIPRFTLSIIPVNHPIEGKEKHVESNRSLSTSRFNIIGISIIIARLSEKEEEIYNDSAYPERDNYRSSRAVFHALLNNEILLEAIDNKAHLRNPLLSLL